MNFEEAAKHLEDGEYVQRSAWSSTGEYLVALPGIPHYWKITTQPAQNAGIWVFTREEHRAEDYEVFKKTEDAVVTDAA